MQARVYVCVLTPCLSHSHTIMLSADGGRMQKCEAFGVNGSFAMPSFISEQEITWWGWILRNIREMRIKKIIIIKINIFKDKCLVEEINDYR